GAPAGRTRTPRTARRPSPAASSAAPPHGTAPGAVGAVGSGCRREGAAPGRRAGAVRPGAGRHLAGRHLEGWRRPDRCGTVRAVVDVTTLGPGRPGYSGGVRYLRGLEHLR